ncbi:DUF5808 domain-containing protein [Paenibacillus lycopersici]|nr:DUF5808 domain-containing protein [Paenibacillus lycopersici]
MFMTITLIQLFPILILYLAMWATYRPLASYKNGMLFAVTLPAHAIEHPAVGAIQVRFKKQFARLSIWLGAAALPLLALNAWEALNAYSFIYFFAWLTVFIVGMAAPGRRAFRATLALKREQEWFVGKKNVVHGDLRAARMKNATSAPIGLFAFPLAISIGTLLWAIREEEPLTGIAYAGIGLTLLLAIAAYYMGRMKAQAFSANSDLNLSLNQARRRALSYMWLLLAIAQSVHAPLLIALLSLDSTAEIGIWITVPALLALVSLLLVLTTYRRIHAREQEALSQDGQAIYTDDDEYWANGFTYHNPYDNAVIVPKRIGIGTTINTGTVAGKIIAGGIVALFAGTIIVVSFLLIRSELTSPMLTLTAEHRIEIDYPMYDYGFPLADIEQLDLVDEVPKGNRTNGEGTPRVARGKFTLKGLGAARLYVYKNNPPYIRIKLRNTYIFFNDLDPERTKQLYAQLEQAWQP